jgi:hypothetical protein
MAIPEKVIKQIELGKPNIPTKIVKIIVEAHQTRINIPAEMSELLEIKKGDKMKLTIEENKLIGEKV